MTPKTLAAPVAPSERVVMLDVLRGLAIFGILIVNMQIFYQPLTLMITGYQGSAALSETIPQYIIKFFFEGKFYVLFSFLFGYGFWLFMAKKPEDGGNIVPVFRRRIFFLLVFGLLHIVFLWAGDILTFYAIFGFILLLFRRMSDRGLIIWAVILVLIPVAFTGLWVGVVELAKMNPESHAAVEEALKSNSVQMNNLLNKAAAVYAGGSYTEIMSIRLTEYINLLPGVVFFYPTVLAMFLIGLMTARKGIIKNYDRNIPFFRKAFIWGAAVGLPASAFYAFSYVKTQYVIPDIWLLVTTLAHIVGGIALCASYVSAIVLLIHKGRLKKISSLLAPVGRMALTNYLLHSIICTMIFYSYGLGFFGRINAWHGILLAAMIFSLQIPFSNYWLKRFHYGPFEWLWRSLTYMKFQPFIRNN